MSTNGKPKLGTTQNEVTAKRRFENILDDEGKPDTTKSVPSGTNQVRVMSLIPGTLRHLAIMLAGR
jgi:hypothetical protein